MKRSVLPIVSILALVIVAGLLTSTPISSAQDGRLPRLFRVRNGDINGDGARDMSDMIAGLQWLFSGGPAPVDPEGDDPKAEQIASIQARAESILANLPTAEQIAKFPPRFRPGFLKVRAVFTAAVQDAQSWTPKDLRHYGDSVSWVGIYLSTAVASLSELHPELIDPNCIPRCVAEHDECMAGCPAQGEVTPEDQFLPGLTYSDCKMECDLKLADCVAGCMP